MDSSHRQASMTRRRCNRTNGRVYRKPARSFASSSEGSGGATGHPGGSLSSITGLIMDPGVAGLC